MWNGRPIAATVLTVVLLAVFACPSQSLAAPEPQRVLIQYQPGEKLSLEKSLAAQGGAIHFEFDDLNLLAVTLPASSVAQIQGSAAVVRIEPDLPRYPAEQTIPYGVLNVEAPRVWDADQDGVVDVGAPTGSNRMVCIVDSGVYRAHEDLAGVNIVGGYPSGWDTDLCGHGTHIAGTVAAMNNGTGVVGVTPGTASLFIVKVLGDSCSYTYSSNIIDAAIRCRDAGANIVSMSLTSAYPSSWEETMFQRLHDEGMLFVAAAGNLGTTAYSYPASYPAVISVGAVDQNNVVANFSQRNDQVELSAPGVGVYSTSKDGGYVTMSGTSMATPHVAAAAAVVWSAHPEMTAAEIRSTLQQSALDLGVPGRDSAYGYGLIRSLRAIEELAPPAPTGIELLRFDATPDGESVRLEWETASEIDNLGFNLYRAGSADGSRTRLNDSLIAGQLPGSPLGAVYAFVDEDVVTGESYYYWLEDVDLYGVSTLHGPVVVELLRTKRMPVRPRLAADPCIGSVHRCG